MQMLLFWGLGFGRKIHGNSKAPIHGPGGQSAPMMEMLEQRCLLTAAPLTAALDTAVPAAVIHAKAAGALAAPSALQAKVITMGRIDVLWKNNAAGSASFRIYGKLSTAKEWSVLGTAPAGATRFIAAKLAAGRQYLFRVQAFIGKGVSPGSEIVWATTPVATAGGISGSSSSGGVGSNITYSGPITITHGGTYSGNWQSLNPNVPAIQIRTAEPVTIENSTIRSAGTLIEASDFATNLTVRNCRGYALNPNVRNRYAGRFLNAEQFANIDIENNYLEGTSGIYLYHYVGNHTAAQTVTVLGNQALNIDGRYSDGKGGYLTGPDDNYYVQFFQINGVRNLVGAQVAWNQVINEPGKSRVEDNISIFKTSGTPASPFAIHDNYIQGAYAVDSAHDIHYTGGGIMVSDQGSAFIQAYSNQVISTTNYGIAISSGHDNRIYNNRIVACGTLANGQKLASQNVGIYIWNANSESTFANNTGSGNLIGWARGQTRNDSWTPDSSGWTGNQPLPGTMSLAVEAGEWTIWQNKLTQSGATVGPASS